MVETWKKVFVLFLLLDMLAVPIIIVNIAFLLYFSVYLSFFDTHSWKLLLKKKQKQQKSKIDPPSNVCLSSFN